MKFYDLTGCGVHPKDIVMDAQTSAKMDRLQSMMNQAEALMDRLYGSTDISPALATSGEHLECIIGDLNFELGQLAEVNGPIVSK